MGLGWSDGHARVSLWRVVGESCASRESGKSAVRGRGQQWSRAEQRQEAAARGGGSTGAGSTRRPTARTRVKDTAHSFRIPGSGRLSGLGHIRGTACWADHIEQQLVQLGINEAHKVHLQEGEKQAGRPRLRAPCVQGLGMEHSKWWWQPAGHASGHTLAGSAWGTRQARRIDGWTNAPSQQATPNKIHQKKGHNNTHTHTVSMKGSSGSCSLAARVAAQASMTCQPWRPAAATDSSSRSRPTWCIWP